MRKTFLSAMLLALVCCAAQPSVWAQSKKNEDRNSRTVQGAVTHPDDSPVVGAVVQMKNKKTQQIRSFITKENGTYFFNGLSPDIDYEFRADFQGASSPVKTLSSFDSRRQATINLKLNPKPDAKK